MIILGVIIILIIVMFKRDRFGGSGEYEKETSLDWN